MIDRLQELIENKTPVNCQFHTEKEAHIVCITDSQYLCIDCGLSFDHQHHQKMSTDKMYKCIDEFCKRKNAEQPERETKRNIMSKIEEVASTLKKNLLHFFLTLPHTQSIQENWDILAKFLKSEPVNFNQIKQYLENQQQPPPDTNSEAFKNCLEMFEQIMMPVFLEIMDRINSQADDSNYPQELSLLASSNSTRKMGVTKKIPDDYYYYSSNQKQSTSISQLLQITESIFDDRSLGVTKRKLWDSSNQSSSRVIDLEFSSTGKRYQIQDQQLINLINNNNNNSNLQFPLLEKIRLLFINCRVITDASFKAIAQFILLHHKRLTILEMKIQGCKGVSENGYDLFMQYLTSLTTLKELNLDFEGCQQLTNPTMELFAISLTSLCALEQLSLNFSRCSKINKGIRSVFHSMKKLKLLHQLKLKFNSCKSFSDQAMESFTPFIKQRQNLINLELDLSNTQKLQDISMKLLADALTNHAGIVVLNVNLEKQGDLTDEGAIPLMEAIGTVEKLDMLRINFHLCNRLTQTTVVKLLEALQKRKQQLVSLTANFSQCAGIISENTAAQEGIKAKLAIFQEFLLF